MKLIRLPLEATMKIMQIVKTKLIVINLVKLKMMLS
jgi:hypothetical protein